MEELVPLNSPKAVSDLSNEDWKIAQYRYNIIAPIVNNVPGITVAKVCEMSGVPRRTLHRWLDRYRANPVLSSLAKTENKRNRYNYQLATNVEDVIQTVIQEKYLRKQKLSIRKVSLDVALACREHGLEIPHYSTVRRRIHLIGEEEKLARRQHRSIAENKYQPLNGHFPGADYPLAVVQIDHTPLDIICVDDVYREPVGKPWVTMAIDVYSRMVVGFYISLDPPGALGTGLCLSHAILPKDLWLSSLDVKGKWQCYGVMRAIHMDNAKEFHGKMLERACQEYGIEINFRPVAKPNYGGHIERLLGTVLQEIHTLPGTTFSNTKERKYYDAEGRACFTIKELERWLATFIVGVYHNRRHNSINTTPVARYLEGINGSDTQIGIGWSEPVANELKLKLDFMPFVERTVQRYGVAIDMIWYYGDVLRKWVHAYEKPNVRNPVLRKFAFKRDPRDISAVYFYDPEIEDYFCIPYRNTTHPSITIWEYKQILRTLKARGMEHVDENLIFDTYAQMRDIEEKAANQAAIAKRRKANERKELATKNSIKNEFEREEPEINDTGFKYDPNEEYLPFEELIHDPFNQNNR
ncbi:putative transposase [Mucilaginibacter gracilis]|uniref:Putative transposase n=1 Tax=Mucilaginibacter gracilis TaxID=423350 RepID=A0A495J174_9SPHI|nr:Mu transposase C-terminal domain-containing protein [Mucilaginibacter gracilis]RKR82371.1 putative transposase [Mucilaginibacter gracilis]